MTSSSVRSASPTPLTERALGPDLARGFMLLFIALANSHYFLRGSEEGAVFGGYPRDGSAVDSAVAWLLTTFVDGRAFPMFGLLFGYGIAHIVRRNDGLGRWELRRLLWRRSLILVVVGFLHAILLYVGDILAAYGVLLFVAAWVVRWRSRWLGLLAIAAFVLTAIPSGDSLSTSTDPPGVWMLPPDPLTMLAARLEVVPLLMVLLPFGFVCPFLVGLVAGRLRILQRPTRYRRLLTVVAVSGIGVAVLAAQPVSLLVAGVTSAPDDDTLAVFGSLHDASGVLGGFGYAALIVLVAARLGTRDSRLVTALVATGQRSMTSYLAQSVGWTLIFAPFLLDLADTLTVTGTAALAAGSWLVTVYVADRMRRVGYRGPFETLVRRVTYGRTASG